MKDYSYVKQVMTRKSFPDFFIQLGCKVDWKEWSEIYGMYKVVLSSCEKYNFKPDIIFDIGCGKRPTLGTFLALNIKSFDNIICVDPQLDTNLCNDINGIKLMGCKLDEYISISYNFNDEKNKVNENVLICCNHAHISKNEIKQLTSYFKIYLYVTCPCCISNEFDTGEYIIDCKVDSPKNKYYISTNIEKKGINEND